MDLTTGRLTTVQRKLGELLETDGTALLKYRCEPGVHVCHDGRALRNILPLHHHILSFYYAHHNLGRGPP